MPTVLIPLAEGCEELEAVTLIDLLRRADIKVITASLNENTLITASRGVRMMADTALDKVMYDDFDMLILPGGLPGTTHLDADPRIHAIIKRLYQADKAVAAICAAPLVLAHAGVLEGKTVTCYPTVLDNENTPMTLSGEAVVIDGHVLTSRGPGTAMDFALAIIEYLLDRPTRESVAAGLVR